jgi:DNA repair protein RadC
MHDATTTCRLASALERSKRYFGAQERRVSGPEDSWQLIRHLDDRKQERFVCCTLNSAHDVIAVRVVTVGLINRTIIHPKEIFSEAVASRSSALMIDETDIPNRV